MKKIFFSVLSAVLLMTAAVAQQEPVQNQPASAVNDEHLIMKDGKMYHNMNGKEMVMQNQMMLHNGTVMHTDGSYQLKNGKQRQLRNGHCMDMNGRKYRSHQMFQRTMMRMHGSGMHSGGQHGGMMGNHH
ncbi:MAG: hypothetical protein J0I09_02840 [Sphingobacteriia bacterium]|nr:hypothetical protein [Sphingobacteriia bacterium]